jgi:ketol-acid reductoisomerase
MGGIRKSVVHIPVFLTSVLPDFYLYLFSLTEGMFLAQYKVLRENGHSPSEAFNETVEEATQSLFPLIGANGYVCSFPTLPSSFVTRSIFFSDLGGFRQLPRMDYMYNACSTTARRGALDWAPVFEAANRPVFEKLYQSVRNGTETRKALEFNGRSTYRQDLARELKEIDDQEIWRAGKTVRSLRPDYKP